MSIPTTITSRVLTPAVNILDGGDEGARRTTSPVMDDQVPQPFASTTTPILILPATPTVGRIGDLNLEGRSCFADAASCRVSEHRLKKHNNTDLLPTTLSTPAGRILPIDEPVLLNRVIPELVQTLNFASLGELLQNQSHLPHPLWMKVDALENKRLNYPTRYAYDDYFPQCSVISMLEQSLSTQVCLCGLRVRRRSEINPGGLCNRKRLCYPCAHRLQREKLSIFQPNFHRHSWGFLTISYHGSLPFAAANLTNWDLYWEAAKRGLRRLVDAGMVGGAFMREELAILTLEPTTVQPHIHAIVCQPDVGESAAEILGRWVRAYCDDLGQQVELDPSIDFQPIPTEDDFERIMTYLLKPLDVVTSYRARWAQVNRDEEKARVNRGMRDLLEAYIRASQDRKAQIVSMGNMHASAPEYVGLRPGERN